MDLDRFNLGKLIVVGFAMLWNMVQLPSIKPQVGRLRSLLFWRERKTVVGLCRTVKSKLRIKSQDNGRNELTK